MTVVPLEVEGAFSQAARGPELVDWILADELYFEDSNSGYPPSIRSIQGAQVKGGWVIFHGLQVIQIVPDEVHSRWHLGLLPEIVLSCVWRIDDSEWLQSFTQCHLGGHHHFLVEFYDEKVEVICRELLFGAGTFNLDEALQQFPQLCYAYQRRAFSREHEGRYEEAAADLTTLAEITPDPETAEWARRRRGHLLNR